MKFIMSRIIVIHNGIEKHITYAYNKGSILFSCSVKDDMDQDDMCDDGSDVDDHASETDSKKSGSRTPHDSTGDGKSQGSSSKPRR